MTDKLKWKQLDDSWEGPKPNGYTYVAEVPHGWLVSVWAGTDKDQRWGGGLTFVPDPEKKWDPLLLKNKDDTK